MTDFTQDDLLDAVDRAVRETLERSGQRVPPVDAVALAERVFGFQIEEVEPDEEAPPARYGDPPKRKPRANTLVFQYDQTDESRNTLAARAIAKRLVPTILERLGVVIGTENRSALTPLNGLIVPRLLLPTRNFGADARRAGYDVLTIKSIYPTAGFEAIVMRILDVDDEPCVMTIVDDGNIVFRRSNRFSVGRKLTPAEESCIEQMADHPAATRGRSEGWRAWGWPTPGVPFRRIILRAVPDELQCS